MKRLSIVVVALIACSHHSLSPLNGAETKSPHILFMIGEREYRTNETLPEFSKAELEPRGFRTTFVHADANNPNHFPGLDALKDADLLFVSVRRRTLTGEQMKLIRDHLEAGKGLIGIRTSSHAFALRRGEPPQGHVVWQEFDSDVLGHNYVNHYSNKEGTMISVAPGSEDDPLLAGITAPSFRSGGTLYVARDIATNATVLFNGNTVIDGDPKTEPVSLRRVYKKSRIFYTSLGHIDDFKEPAFRRLLVNAVHWTLNRSISGETK